MFFATQLWANECKLKPNETITIGCAFDCGFSNKWRLKTSAQKLGYKIDFIDLRELPTSDDPMEKIDALLVPGGADINPDLYLTPDLPSEFVKITQDFRQYFNASEEGKYRDEYEFNLLKKYFTSNTKKPLLGICRGMQMMTVSQGIPLYLDLKAEKSIPNRYTKWDKISIDADTLMDQLFSKATFRGYKYHHQGARMDYWEKYADRHPHIRYTSFSNQGIIAEAMEVPGRPILGVQFHPEKSMPKVKHKIFGWLLKQACLSKRGEP